jgi:hypothetical protein
MDAEYCLENLGDEGYSRSGLPKRTSRTKRTSLAKRTSRKKASWITDTASGRLDRSYRLSWQRRLGADGQGRSHYLDTGLVSFILLLLVPT